MHNRQETDRAASASRSSNATAKTPKKRPGCLHKNARPKSSPLRKSVEGFAGLPRAQEQQQAAQRVETTRWVACPSIREPPG